MALHDRTQVLVVGAGPVGQFAALSLAERGVAVEVVDKDWRGSSHSYALALHPQTLRLLDEYGAADELMSQGHRIERLAFYDGDVQSATFELAKLGGPFSSVLVVPQSVLEQSLEKTLKAKGVKVHWNHEAHTVNDEGGRVVVEVNQLEKSSVGYPIARTEWMVRRTRRVEADFVIGADGYLSGVRERLGIDFEQLGDEETFAVFEFPCRFEFPHEGRFVFRGSTTSAVWPLGERRGRWSFQVDPGALPPQTPESLLSLIIERAPWFPTKIDEIYWTTVARFERRLAARFGEGRVWLAGDAAHVTGPVGAQSMNVGIAEAHALAERMSAVIKAGDEPISLQRYGAEARDTWLQLLRPPAAGADPQDWSVKHAAKLLPCLPASGDELRRMLLAIGLMPAV